MEGGQAEEFIREQIRKRYVPSLTSPPPQILGPIKKNGNAVIDGVACRGVAWRGVACMGILCIGSAAELWIIYAVIVGCAPTFNL